jgi:hypothetical protein
MGTPKLDEALDKTSPLLQHTLSLPAMALSPNLNMPPIARKYPLPTNL